MQQFIGERKTECGSAANMVNSELRILTFRYAVSAHSVRSVNDKWHVIRNIAISLTEDEENGLQVLSSTTADTSASW